MKKYIFQIILICSIFLYENTSVYWIYQLGELSGLIRLLYVVVFLITVMIAIYNVARCIEARFKDKRFNIITILMIIVLLMPFIIPEGLMSKRVLYKGDPLVAYLDGVAGNNGWLILYGNNIYEYNYGGSQQKGKYKVERDTIYFDSPKGEDTYNFDYATLWSNNSHLSFGKDSIAYFHMEVVKNDLIK